MQLNETMLLSTTFLIYMNTLKKILKLFFLSKSTLAGFRKNKCCLFHPDLKYFEMSVHLCNIPVTKQSELCYSC